MKREAWDVRGRGGDMLLGLWNVKQKGWENGEETEVVELGKNGGVRFGKYDIEVITIQRKEFARYNMYT